MAKRRSKRGSRTSSLELFSILTASRANKLTALHEQFLQSLTPEQRLMLATWASVRGTDVNKILTKLVGLVTVEVLEQVERRETVVTPAVEPTPVEGVEPEGNTK